MTQPASKRFLTEAAGTDLVTTAVGGKSAALIPTGVKTAGYTAAVSDFVPVDATTAAVAVTLPAAPADRTRVGVKKLDTSSNVVTIARGGSTDVFNKVGGSTLLSLLLTNQSVTVQYQASTGIWYVVDSDLPYSQVVAAQAVVNAARYSPLLNAVHTTVAVDQVPLAAIAIAGETADIFQVQDKDGIARVKVDSGNVLWAPQIRARGDQVGTVPVVVEGATGLTADIAKFRAAPGGSDLARIRVDGRVTAPNLTELVFNVKDYGAKGDGAASDTTAIQSAITAATAAGGGTVYLPAGTYMVNAFIGLKDRVSIRGAGADATILKAKTGLTVGILVGATADTVNDLTISDLAIDGDYTGSAIALNGIQITTALRVAVRDCTVRNLGKMGVLVQTTSADCSVTRCQIADTGQGDPTNGYGIRVVASQRILIAENTVQNARGMGISFGDPGAGVTYSRIIGNYISNTFAGAGYEAIALTFDCNNNVVTDNVIQNAADNGISCSGRRNTIANNTIDGTQNHGIMSGNGTTTGSGCDNTITGNVIRNGGQEVSASTYGGIGLSATAIGCVVTGNRCLDDQTTKTQDYGVKETAGANYNLITGNVLRDNLTAGVLLAGANSVNTNNITA